MRKKLLLTALFLSLFGGSIASASAADACEVVLCMYGKAVGSGGGECRGAEKAFFKINVFKKRGRFNPSKTFDLRRSFLGNCASADPAAVAKILSKFGRIRG